jgi:hypothetical protein
MINHIVTYQFVKDKLIEAGLPQSMLNQYAVDVVRILSFPCGNYDNCHNIVRNSFTRLEVLSYLSNHLLYSNKDTNALFQQVVFTSLLPLGILEDNGEARNSPYYRIRLSNMFFAYLKEGKNFYVEKNISQLGVSFDTDGSFVPFFKTIQNKFIPKFIPDANCVLTYYKQSILYKNDVLIKELGVNLINRINSPCVVMYDVEKNELIFLVCVISSLTKSLSLLEKIKSLSLTSNNIKIRTHLLFESVFNFKKHFNNIIGKADIWIAEEPEFIVHFSKSTEIYE